jgi:sterol 3beta-glucosyltransferase
MRITVNTFGTRGDIQPYVALSLGLQHAGHTVRIVTHRIFAAFVQEHGLDFYPLDLDPRQVLIQQALSELGNNRLRITRWLKENYRPVLRDLFAATLDASRNAELMLNSGLSFAGWHVAEKLGIPALATYLWPVTPSRHLPATTGSIPPPWLPLRGAVNYLSAKLSNQLFFKLMSPLVNECRKDILDLRPLGIRDYWPLDSARGGTPIIYGFSPSVIPRPPDWGDGQQVAGYWFLDTEEAYQARADLLDFLGDGPPPVYVGFGSMVDHEREVTNKLIIDALQEAGQRGILQAGWSELGAGHLPDSVFRLGAVPHDWLFPQMAAVVHHGGAGTTATALRAGVPSVVVPWFGDQFFWGWRVQEVGAGPAPITRSRLTTTKLAIAIQQAVSDETIKRTAAQLGQQIRSEDGVGTAVRWINAFTQGGHARHE